MLDTRCNKDVEAAIDRVRRQGANARDLAEKALLWAIYAARPLSIRELQAAIAINEDKEKSNEESVVPVEDIISACAGLVALDKEGSVLRLTSQTTQEYLAWTLNQRSMEPHARLAKACITVLTSTQSNSLLDYASKFWSHHLRQEPATQGEAWVLEIIDTKSIHRALSELVKFYTTDQATGLHLAAYFSLDIAVDALLQRGHDPNVPGGHGRTPIFYAAKGGHCSTINVLFEHAAKIDAKCDDFNRWAMQDAAHNNFHDVVELLLDIEAKVDPGIKEWEYRDAKNMAFNRAVCCGEESMATLLLDRGASIEYQDSLGTPFINATQAAIHGSRTGVNLTQLLLDCGADINAQDTRGQTALHHSLRSSSTSQLSLVLSNDPDLEIHDTFNRTALTYAAELGKPDMVRLLLKHEVNVKGSPLGPTPLYLAVYGGHGQVVKLLSEEGADPGRRTECQGILALESARRRGEERMVVLMREYVRDERIGWQEWLGSCFR